VWVERISALADCCNFYPPATPAQVAGLEAALGVKLPGELRGLLQETNGLSVSPPSLCEPDECYSLVWSVEEILEENRQFREMDAAQPSEDSFPSLSSLLFVASDFNGDFFAYRVSDGAVSDTTLIGMSHENWSEHWKAAGSLWERLEAALTAVAKIG
jgi:hypothetical protein